MELPNHYHHFILLLPLLCGCRTPAVKETQSPNLVLIIADQWRGKAIGYLNEEPVFTPNIDRLAGEGIHCLNAISSYPVSSPARAMLMTGQYPVKNGVTGNCNSETAPYGVELKTKALCWSDIIKEKGYEMGYIGKWHLDAPVRPFVDTSNNKGAIAWNEWCPPERRHGFDYWLAYGTYDNHLNPMYWENDALRDSFFYAEQWGPSFEAGKAIGFLKDARKKDKPFALVVSMNPPHTGYELVPEPYKELYRNLDVDSIAVRYPHIPPEGTLSGHYFRKNLRNYYACMTGVDKEVGRIINALKEEGLFENTIVVFTSDHGDSMGMHDHTGKNIYYEEAIHIPFIISWPEKLKPGINKTLPVAFADLYPTLLSLMGFKESIPEEIETYDLSEPLMNGEEPEILQPYYKIQPDNLLTGYRGLRSKEYTFVIRATEGCIDEVILFNRADDPFQMKNIAPQSPELVENFTASLYEWLTKTNDPFASCLKSSYIK
jgi:arylsulfatase A-like enzyme